MGLTKMTEGLTLAELQRPRAKMPADVTPERIPSSMPNVRPDFATRPSDAVAQPPP